MLDLGWMEMAVIVVIALLVVGPRELPRVIRSINEWLGKARSMAREFKSGLDDIAEQTELASLKNDMQEIADDANNSMLTDEAASTHDFIADSGQGDDYWNSMSGAWRYVEPGDGAKKNPKRVKRAKAPRPKLRQGAAKSRTKVRE